jgi:flagellar hook protein FlgE
MGSFDALGTAISGLQAQAFAFQNISGNIANSTTTAFKATNTHFEDFVNPDNGSGSQASGFTQALSRATNYSQGTIQTSTVPTYMAINGTGYFTVERPSSRDAAGQPKFDTSTTAYSRRGDFQMDANGYLVNGAGYYLMGSPIDPVTGGATSGALQPLKFDTTTSLPTLGNLQSLSVSPQGRIQGAYSNGKTTDVAALPLATFHGQDFLHQEDGQAFTPTAESGAALYTGTGKIVGSATEASNADIDGQMTTMIAAQQAYGANTKVITTTDEMLRTLTNLTI